MVWLLYNLIPIICRSFLDDVAIKGLNIDYNNKEILDLLRVRRYIVEYIKNFNNVFYNLKLVSVAINTYKLEWYKY
jgi:hypothetical protein